MSTKTATPIALGDTVTIVYGEPSMRLPDGCRGRVVEVGEGWVAFRTRSGRVFSTLLDNVTRA